MVSTTLNSAKDAEWQASDTHEELISNVYLLVTYLDFSNQLFSFLARLVLADDNKTERIKFVYVKEEDAEAHTALARA